MALNSDCETGLFGHEISNQVNFASKLFATSEDRDVILSQDLLHELVTLAFDYFHRRQFSRTKFNQLKNKVVEYWDATQLLKQLNLSSSDFDLFFAGLLSVTQTIGRNIEVYRDQTALANEIVRGTKLPSDVINRLMVRFVDPATTSHYFPLYSSGTGNRILSMTWRIKVIISDKHLSKLMEPVVVIDLVFSDSQNNSNSRRQCSFECRLAAFHRLRFMTATLLNEMLNLEQKINNLALKN